MNCSDPGPAAYQNFQGQSTLNDIYSQRYAVPAVAMQADPYASAPQPGYTSMPSQTYPTAPQTGYPAIPPGLPTVPGVTSPSAPVTPSPRGMTGSDLLPITPSTEPASMTLESVQYLNGALRTQIGRRVTISFLIGTNTFVDRTGTLLGVGSNYVIINEEDTDDITFCDYYTIKFVKVYH